MIPNEEKKDGIILQLKKIVYIIKGIKDGIILQLKNCLHY